MPVNHVVLASGAVVAVSVAITTAMAMYENPELRRYADDIRRRIAMALHSLGNGISPPERAPVFNRPEDAEGFRQSSRGTGAGPGVDADEETRRRQREELMYWNAVRLQKKEDEEETTRMTSAGLPTQHRSSSPAQEATFDDILRGGAGLRHRSGLASIVYANPFADENFIDAEEVPDLLPAAENVARKEDDMSDIYSATTRETDDARSRTLDGSSPALIALSPSPLSPSPPAPSDENVTAGQLDGDGHGHGHGHEEEESAYASIQAWAHDSSRSFYSAFSGAPAPAPASVSGTEAVTDGMTDGQLTPTDSVSVIGASEGAETGREAQPPFDVLSESEGMLTPASWSDVGSVVSESEAYGGGQYA